MFFKRTILLLAGLAWLVAIPLTNRATAQPNVEQALTADTTKVRVAEEPPPPYDIDSVFSFPGRVVIPADSNPGFLILNGEFIDPPYEIVLEGTTLTVNGKSTEAPPPAKPKAPIVVDSLAKARIKAESEHAGLFRTWCREYGIEEAQKRSLAYWEASPFAEYAYFKHDFVLRIKFRGKSFEEELWLYSTPKPSITPEQRRRQWRESEAVMLQRALSQGDLVVKMGGFERLFHQPRAAAVLDTIKTILNGSLDSRQKVSEIRRFIPHQRAAELIIERNSGK